MASWKGKSRGGKGGYVFIIFLLKYTSLSFVYFFIRFVSFYFLIASDKTSIKFYFQKIHGYGKLKTLLSIYRNYYKLGQVLIDKITVLSGVKKAFTYDFEGEEYLHEMVKNKKGGMLIGAHIGNWEVAGHLLKRLGIKINIIMFEEEHEKIKETLEKNNVISDSNIIPIKSDLSHLVKIKEAFSNNEFVVIHGDRSLNDTSSITMKFMGKPALFPTSPIYLACKNGAPVSFVYSVKESALHSHFYATKPKIYPYPAKIKTRKKEFELMVGDYINSLETIIKKHPLQWFNYHKFWDEEKK